MTTGRPIVEPLEDENYVYINGFVIPKGKTKSDIEARENLIWDMYNIWCSENPSKKRINTNLQSDISVTEDSIHETAHHAGKSYKTTLAFYYLDFVLKNAVKVAVSQPNSNRQKKLVRGGYMQEMKLDNIDSKFLKKIKLMLGVRRNGNKIMYSLTEVKA